MIAKNKNYIIKPKFRPGDIVYFKSPSRYSRSRAPDTVEILLKIVGIEPKDDFRTRPCVDYYYLVYIVKTISCAPVHWSTYNNPEPFGVESLELETHSRQLTAAEKVLYG